MLSVPLYCGLLGASNWKVIVGGRAQPQGLQQEACSCPPWLCCEPAVTAWLLRNGAATLAMQHLQFALTQSSKCSGKVQVPATCCMHVWNAMWVAVKLHCLSAGRIA